MRMINKYNYHTHTYRCKHAFGTDEEYVLAAIEAGYRILGFSDHAPYRDYPSRSSHMDWEQLDGYLESILSLREKYKDRIEIHLGMETEYYSHCHEERKELKGKVEYLLLGQHFSDPGENKVSYFRNNTDQEILTYADSVCTALDTGLFTYLCHPDVFMNRQTEFTEACEIAAHRIAQKAVETDTPLEVNIRGSIRGKMPFPQGERFYYPHREFWEIASQYPIRCTIGVDAHHPKDLLEAWEHVDACLDELKDLDLHFIEEPLL